MFTFLYRGNIVKAKNLVLFFLFLSNFIPASVLANSFTVFGSETYVRADGKPKVTSTPFSVLNPNTIYIMKVFYDGEVSFDKKFKKRWGKNHRKGKNDEFEKHKAFVSSAFITLNGKRIFGPRDFKGKGNLLRRTVKLKSQNELSVMLRGNPQGKVKIEIIGVDRIPPVSTAAVNPDPNEAGWHNQTVTVSFVSQDEVSGIAVCPDPIVVEEEGEGQVFTGTAVDAAGNSASTSVTLNIDKTPSESFFNSSRFGPCDQ